MNEENSGKESEPLGHGDHWQALGMEGEPLIEYVHQLTEEVGEPRLFPAPWPGGEFSKIVLMSAPRASLCFVVLSGVNEQEGTLSLLSAFPELTRTEEWIVDVDGASADYGPYEGVVNATAAAGHGLCFFVPYFGLEAEHWKRQGLTRVALAGLALKLETFDAEPLRITEGPRVEEAKSELRAQGRDAEADDPDFHVTFYMDSLRSLYSLNQDHHQIFGRVLSVTPVKPLPQFRGWRLEVECMPDEAANGCRLPVYVFPPAIGSEAPPRKGDLVTGTVWLQGTWVAAASRKDEEIWKESARGNTADPAKILSKVPDTAPVPGDEME